MPVELDNVGIINVFIEVMSGIDIAEDNSIPVSFLLPVHGGLTWANHYEMLPKREKKLWWFGFDCMHSGDFVPGLHDEQMSPYSFPTRYTKQLVYRDQDYVTNQVKQLAEKLRLLASLPELNDHKQTESRDSVSQAPPDGHQ